MAINWRLKTYLSTKHGIFKATEFQKLIVKKTGTLISIPTLCNYINKKPSALPLKTIELICSTLNCKLSAFCEVSPKNYKNNSIKKLSYKNTPDSKKAVNNFPNPRNYK